MSLGPEILVFWGVREPFSAQVGGVGFGSGGQKKTEKVLAFNFHRKVKNGKNNNENRVFFSFPFCGSGVPYRDRAH